MNELDEIMNYVIETVSTNVEKGQNSLISIRITPVSKISREDNRPRSRATLTNDDVIAADETFERFDGNFKQVFQQK